MPAFRQVLCSLRWRSLRRLLPETTVSECMVYPQRLNHRHQILADRLKYYKRVAGWHRLLSFRPCSQRFRGVFERTRCFLRNQVILPRYCLGWPKRWLRTLTEYSLVFVCTLVGALTASLSAAASTTVAGPLLGCLLLLEWWRWPTDWRPRRR